MTSDASGRICDWLGKLRHRRRAERTSRLDLPSLRGMPGPPNLVSAAKWLTQPSEPVIARAARSSSRHGSCGLALAEQLPSPRARRIAH